MVENFGKAKKLKDDFCVPFGLSALRAILFAIFGKNFTC